MAVHHLYARYLIGLVTTTRQELLPGVLDVGNMERQAFMQMLQNSEPGLINKFKAKDLTFHLIPLKIKIIILKGFYKICRLFFTSIKKINDNRMNQTKLLVTKRAS